MDVEAPLAKDLGWIAKCITRIGSLSYMDPWGLTALAGEAAHPMAREIVLKQLPLILRSQYPDGGWGGVFRRSFLAVRALARHGLFDALRELPALPPDWRVVRSIPAPAIETPKFPDKAPYRTMTWGDGCLWVYSPQEQAAIAVSPEGGGVIRRVAIPDEGTFGVGWWRDGLVYVPGEPVCGSPPEEPPPVRCIDPHTGDVRQEIPTQPLEQPAAVAGVGDKLWVTDHWQGVTAILDGKGGFQRVLPPRGAGVNLAPADDGVWSLEMCDGRLWLAPCTPVICKTILDPEPITWDDASAASYLNAPVLDFGDKPFGDASAGIAWDGKNLWALDAGGRRICMIEKAEPSQNLSQRRQDAE